jgi:hypothetical protein
MCGENSRTNCTTTYSSTKLVVEIFFEILESLRKLHVCNVNRRVSGGQKKSPTTNFGGQISILLATQHF